jgi:predicted transglutaminase-like cysteine proteinase
MSAHPMHDDRHADPAPQCGKQPRAAPLRRHPFAFMLALLALVFAAAVVDLRQGKLQHFELTDGAFTASRALFAAPRVGGHITAAWVTDTQDLLAGDVVDAPPSAQPQGRVDTTAHDPAPSPITAPAESEPFGLGAMPVESAEILMKWSGLEADLRAEHDILARCRDSAAPCPAPAQKFLAVIAEGQSREGRARIGVINRAINLAIRPTSDLAQWGIPDRWSTPLVTLATGRGDCEDYAIAKYEALREAGVDARDLRLVIVRDLVARADHAVVAARLEGQWIVLDNRHLALVADVDLRRMVPIFVLDDGRVRQFAARTIADARHTVAPSAGGRFRSSFRSSGSVGSARSHTAPLT